jgi:hypothetical protein
MIFERTAAYALAVAYVFHLSIQTTERYLGSN